VPAVESTAVNPRYRRLVIPGALLGLLVIVLVASLVRG